jgi:hypothetical protein
MKSRRMRWVENAAHVRKMKNVYRILSRKPEGKRSLGRYRCTLEDNIKMDLKEIRYEGMDCIYLSWDRDQWKALVNMVMGLWVL